MSARWGRMMMLLALLTCLCWGMGACSDFLIKESMGDRETCEKGSEKILWISGKTSAIIIGRTEDTVWNCQLKFGLATAPGDARLRLSFDFIYIEDCGVQLQINESNVSDFTQDKSNKEMFLSECNSKNPGPLYAHPKNFVLITLKRERLSMESYNFRLNISMAEQLPTTGPDLHVVIIIGFVLVIVVITAAILLFKYVTRLSSNWREQRAEEAVTRAINIYNSLEPLEEPDLVYLTPGGEGPQAIGLNGNHSNRHGHGGGEIAFVHSDGRLERFRPRDGPVTDKRGSQTSRKQQDHQSKSRQHFHGPQNSNDYSEGDDVPSSSQPARMRLDVVPVRRQKSHGADLEDTASVGGCEMPPSYEEALEMPAPQEIGGATADRESTIDEEETENIAVGGRLELDYMNIHRDDHRNDMHSSRREENEEEENDPEASGSGQALLSFTQRDKRS